MSSELIADRLDDLWPWRFVDASEDQERATVLVVDTPVEGLGGSISTTSEWVATLELSDQMAATPAGATRGPVRVSRLPHRMHR
jgi:hypothetical protein